MKLRTSWDTTTRTHLFAPFVPGKEFRPLAGARNSEPEQHRNRPHI